MTPKQKAAQKVYLEAWTDYLEALAPIWKAFLEARVTELKACQEAMREE